jgi:hypothetical protein
VFDDPDLVAYLRGRGKTPDEILSTTMIRSNSTSLTKIILLLRVTVWLRTEFLNIFDKKA